MHVLKQLVTLLNVYSYVGSSALSGDTREDKDIEWLFSVEEII